MRKGRKIVNVTGVDNKYMFVINNNKYSNIFGRWIVEYSLWVSSKFVSIVGARFERVMHVCVYIYIYIWRRGHKCYRDNRGSIIFSNKFSPPITKWIYIIGVLLQAVNAFRRYDTLCRAIWFCILTFLLERPDNDTQFTGKSPRFYSHTPFHIIFILYSFRFYFGYYFNHI